MQILAHRGFWTKAEEKNSIEAIQRAFNSGYGIETDVRDYNGKLVISHNVPDENCPLFEEALKIYRETGCEAYLAINIKADGIQKLLWDALREYQVEKYFVFDMSVPEQVVYRSKGIHYFTRLSEYETEPVLLEDSMGIWMDEWHSSWITSEIVQKYLNMGKMVGVISSEIHGANPQTLWKQLSEIHSENLLLCTDDIKRAEAFFSVCRI